MYLPTATPPVNVTRSTSGLVSISSAISRGSPVTTANIAGRQPRLVEHVGKQERRQRRLLGGLQHHPVVGAECRRDLVRDLVQRVVERRDRADRALQRLAQRVDLARLAVGRQVAGEHLAVVDERRVAGEREHVAGPADLVERVLLAEAALGGDEVRDRIGATPEDLGSAVGDPRALVARELRATGARHRERVAHVLHRALRHGAHEGAVPGTADFDHAIAPDALAVDAHLLAQHVTVAQARELVRSHASRWLSARSNASKLRQRR